MNALFTKAPLFVPTMRKANFVTHDLEERVHEIEQKEEAYGSEHVDVVHNMKR